MVNLITVPRYLTSSEFYNSLLKNINYALRDHSNNNPIILDFSETVKIEPLTMPVLLCLGEYVRRIYGTRIVLRIPDTLKAAKIKFYMYNIKFTYWAKKVFTIEGMLEGGMDEDSKLIDPLCTSLFFPANLKKDEIINEVNLFIAPFSNAYLEQYKETMRVNMDIEKGKNEVKEVNINTIDHFLYEFIDNSNLHGKSDVYMTIHARYSDRKVYIAVADSGVGFLKSWNSRQKEAADYEIEKQLLNGRIPTNEIEAILCGIYKRENSQIYGLYNIVLRTLRLGGIIRVHSNDTQVILTSRLLEKIERKQLLLNENFLEWNVRRGMVLKGSHIELEIPF